MKNTLRRFSQILLVASSAALLLVGAVFVHSQGAHAEMATSTPPTLSNITATPSTNSAVITWTTDLGATTQVTYGTTTDYGSFSVLDATAVTNHSVTLTSLMPGTMYNFYVISSGSNASSTATSSNQTFFTVTIPTSTPTTTPSDLDDRVSDLEDRVTTLEGQVQWILNHLHDGDHGGGTSTPPSGEPAFIDQDGKQVRAGTNTDFGGHNFGSEEHIKVTMGGSQVATGLTNLEGSFSTGSVTVPSLSGTYTYTFTGLSSGKSATAMITVIP